MIGRRLALLAIAALAACANASTPPAPFGSPASPRPAPFPSNDGIAERPRSPWHGPSPGLGAVVGVVSGVGGVALNGATVVLSSPHSFGSYSTVTRDDGSYRIGNLKPGDDYTLTFYYNHATRERSAIRITPDETTYVSQQLVEHPQHTLMPKCSELEPDESAICAP